MIEMIMWIMIITFKMMRQTMLTVITMVETVVDLALTLITVLNVHV